MKTIIAGSRSINNPEHLLKAVADLPWDITEVVCGKASGADALGDEWARRNGIPVTYFPAQWKRYGARAGYLRNLDMAVYAEALLLLWDGQSKGSKHMLDIATERGLQIFCLMIEDE